MGCMQGMFEKNKKEIWECILLRRLGRRSSIKIQERKRKERGEKKERKKGRIKNGNNVSEQVV